MPAASSPWSQYRGDGTGHSRELGLPLEWSEEKNIAWKTELPGRGWSSPVILGGKVWMTTALEDEGSLRLLAVDMDTGELSLNVEVFAVETWQGIHADNSHASPTPVVEPGRICVHFGTYGTACYRPDGKLIWRSRPFDLDYEVGPGSSPILWQNLLIVHFDATDGQFVAAFDKESGEIVWKTERHLTDERNPPHRKAFSTPRIYHHRGQARLLSTGATHTSAYDPTTGKEIWWLPHDGYSNVPMPMVGLGHAFVNTGYNRPHLLAVPLGGEGRLDPETHLRWSYYWQVPANPSPLLIGGRIYMVNDQGNASWLDARAGKDLWRQRLKAKYYASPLVAHGRIYNWSIDGGTTVIKASDTFEVLATNSLDDEIRATPAVADSSFFIRTRNHLYRVQTLHDTPNGSSNHRSSNAPVSEP